MHYPTFSAFLLATLPAYTNALITDENHPNFDPIEYGNEIARRVTEQFDGTTLDELAALDSLDSRESDTYYRAYEAATLARQGSHSTSSSDSDGDDDDAESDLAQFEAVLASRAVGGIDDNRTIPSGGIRERMGISNKRAACHAVKITLGGRTKTFDPCKRDADDTREELRALLAQDDEQRAANMSYHYAGINAPQRRGLLGWLTSGGGKRRSRRSGSLSSRSSGTGRSAVRF